jgi:hypothetical protein
MTTTKIVRVFTGSDQRSHFEDIHLEMSEFRLGSLVITLFGAVEITVGDGSYRIFGPGDILFAEDLQGEGHKARELIGPRRSLILPVSNEFSISEWKNVK